MSTAPAPTALPINLALALTFFNFTGSNAMRVLLTLYVLELGAPTWVVGVVGGLLFLFPLLLSWPIGAMADRRAARGLLLFAAGCSFASLLLVYFFPLLPVFYAAAALNGLALAFFHVTLQNLVGTLSSPDDRPRNFANFSMAGAMTSFVGPLIAGVAIDAFGYAWACLIIASLSLVVVALLLTLGRHLPPAQPRAGQAAAPRLAIDRTMRTMLVTSGMVQLGSDLFQFYLPIHGHALGLSASAIGAALAAFAVASFIVRVFLPRLVSRFSGERLLMAVFVAGAAGFAIVPFTHDVYTLSAVAFLFGLGMGIGIPLTVILMYASSAKGQSGQALGLRLTANNLVRMAGPMVFGALGAVVGTTGVFWILGALMIAGGWAARGPTAGASPGGSAGPG